MDVFNPKILDASIRDVSSCLSDNQKVELLLYAIKSIHFEGRSRTIVENAIESCLQVTTLGPETIAKARILRARARLANGSHFSAQEDLQAALDAEPDNPEAKALLHQRSVAVEKLLSPLPINKNRFSIEIWLEIALFLPRRDLKSLLFVPHAISRVASQLLFRELDLHFGELKYSNTDDDDDDWRSHEARADDGARHAQRSADILTRIIVDPAFAHCVRTLRIFASTRDGGLAFQTGMLTNALPKLVNLRNVHISSGAEGLPPVLRILQSTNPRLRGLSLQSPDYPADLSFLDFRYISHFTYTGPPVPTQTNSSTLAYASLQNVVSSNRTTLRTINLFTPSWPFPSHSVSIRNLTRIHFAGTFPANQSSSTPSHSGTGPYIYPQVISELIEHGRQLESLSVDCTLLESTTLSAQFRTDPIPPIHPHPLPFLRHFAFAVRALGRRTIDKDLFPSITSFLRGRYQLQTLQLVVDTTPTSSYVSGVGGVVSASNLEAIGYDASIWGLLPSLGGLKAVRMTYPRDLAPGLAGWLIPRSVTALGMEIGAQRLSAGLDGAPGSTSGIGPDVVTFFTQLRLGLPPDLRFVYLNDIPISTRIVHAIVEHGFPMVRVIRVGSWFWTVSRKQPGGLSSSLFLGRSSTASDRNSTQPTPTHHHIPNHAHGGHLHALALSHPQSPHTSGSSNQSSSSHIHAQSGLVHTHSSLPLSLSSTSSAPGGGLRQGDGGMLELEPWPMRRVVYHATEWLEWFGCEEAAVAALGTTREAEAEGVCVGVFR